MGAVPNYGQLLNEIWGWPNGDACWLPYFTSANGISIGQNPPYSWTDFLTMYPQFGAALSTFTAAFDAQSNTITAAGDGSYLDVLVGNFLSSLNIPPGTSVTAIDITGFIFTLSANTFNAATAETVSFYDLVTPPTPGFVPLAVINSFIYLATGSLQYSGDSIAWRNNMGLFVAHYCTLWLRAAAPNAASGGTAAQVVSAGLALGIQNAKAVGDVSVSYTILTAGLENWGTLQLTLYGQQLATWAMTYGSRSFFCY